MLAKTVAPLTEIECKTLVVRLLGQHMVHPAEPVQARHVRVRRVHAQAYLEIPPLPFTILDSL